MLSRVAESFYWMGRYIERAGNTARFLDVNYNLSLDLEPKYVQWEPLVHITGDYQYYVDTVGDFSAEKVMSFLVLDKNYLNSIYSCLSMAKENAKGIREYLPFEFYEILNEAYSYLQFVYTEGDFDEQKAHKACVKIEKMVLYLVGIVEDLSWHGEQYCFYQIGKWLERADKISRILHAKYFYLLPSTQEVGSTVDDVHWGALLRSIDAYDIFQRHCGLLSPEKIINLMVLESSFPRSILFSLKRAVACLKFLETDRPMGLESFKEINALIDDFEKQKPGDIIAQGLHEFINEVQIKINHVNNKVSADFF